MRKTTVGLAVAAASLTMGLSTTASVAMAADSASEVSLEEVVVVGSRVAGRVATDAPVPVDVFTSDDLENQGVSDMDDMLRNLIPSYNVQRLPISDAATITRPATLRGLPPDNTLVLVNGKRRHRSAVIAELGGSLAAGSQGPDISVIPAIAVQQVQVLRDGAAAQYGSDAIAGVINYVLKEDRSGLSFEARYGEYDEGDGELMQLSANLGLPLGPNGFANVSAQWKDAEATSRSLQRDDAAALIATGNDAVPNPAQIWGAPAVEDDYALFVNSGIDLTPNQELYAFGNYAERKVRGGFFYRNPNNRSGVFTQGGTRAIFDTNVIDDPTLANNATPGVSNCPALTSPGGTPTDQAAADADRAAIAALPINCQLFNTRFPGGFTPTFGADVEDISAVVGIRGTMDNGLGYDFSTYLGRNEVAFLLEDTINPSLGLASPNEFDLGKYVQTEQNYTASFVLPVEMEGLHSPLNVAFGLEYRVETFEVRQGQQEAWDAGPFAFQAQNFHADGVTPLVSMSVGANGFAGFGPTQVGEFERANYAAYVDLEADVTERWLVGAAVRFEDFDDFGTTTNFKLASHFKVTDDFSLRGSASTGFRAPTPGQSNVTKVSTVTVDGVLQQRGQIPPTNPIAQFLGGSALDAEDATNFTIGAAWDATDNLTVTLDYFRIELEDRISQTGTIDITTQPVPDGVGCSAAAANLGQCLEELGVPGASDLTSVSFFTNDFDTTTQGVDLVATYRQDWGDMGITNFTAAWNWTDTEVDSIGVAIARNRVSDLENFNPESRGIFTANHNYGPFRVLLRASYYDEWTVGSFSGDPSFTAGNTNYTTDCSQGRDKCYDGEWVFDLEAAYTYNDRYSFVLGGQNFLDNNGPRDRNNNTGIGSGNAFDTSTPFGFDGAFWYARFRVDLN